MVCARSLQLIGCLLLASLAHSALNFQHFGEKFKEFDFDFTDLLNVSNDETNGMPGQKRLVTCDSNFKTYLDCPPGFITRNVDQSLVLCDSHPCSAERCCVPMPAAADAPMSFATDSEGAIRSQDSQTDGIPKCSDHINVASCGTLTDGSRASATSRNANNTCNNTGSGCESDIDTENPSPTGETERDNHLSNGDPEICFAGLPRFEDSVFELIEVPDFSSHPVHVSGSSGKQKLTLTEYEGTATTAGAVGYSFVGTGTCVRLSLSTYGHEGTLSEVPSAGATSLSKLSVFFRDSHLCDDLTCCAAPEQGETPVASCFEGGREVELQTVEGGEYFTLISSVSHDFTLSFDTFAGPCVSCPEGHAHMRGDVDDNVCELEVEEEEKGEVVEIRWEEEEKEMARKRHEMELGTQSEMQEVQAMKNRSLFEGEGGTENVCTGPGVSCSARAEIMSK